MNFSLAKILTGVILLLLAFGGVQSIRLKVAEDRYNAYVVSAEANAVAAAAVKETLENMMQRSVEHEKQEAAKREEKLLADLAAAGDAVSKLRNEAATLRKRLATATRDAAVATANATAELLGECAGKYRDMAAEAQRYADDLALTRNSYDSIVRILNNAR